MDSEYMPRKRRTKKRFRRGNGKRRAKKRRVAMKSLRKAWKKNRRSKKYRTVRSGALKGRRVLTRAARKRIGKRATLYSAALRKRRQRAWFNRHPKARRGRIFRKEGASWVFVDYLTSNVPVSRHKNDLQRWFQQDYGPGVYKFVAG